MLGRLGLFRQRVREEQAAPLHADVGRDWAVAKFRARERRAGDLNGECGDRWRNAEPAKVRSRAGRIRTEVARLNVQLAVKRVWIEVGGRNEGEAEPPVCYLNSRISTPGARSTVSEYFELK